MQLSILIPSIPSRLPKLSNLFAKLEKQISDGNLRDIELLSFLDNKQRSIGYKRDALVQIAKGKYLTFIDDDDMIYDDYLKTILDGTKANTDLIEYKQDVSINGGNIFQVSFSIENENQEARQENGKWVDIIRKPFHTSVWRTSIAQSERFADASYGEDWDWCKRLIPKVKSEFWIDKVLCRYIFDENVTEAEHIFVEE